MYLNEINMYLNVNNIKSIAVNIDAQVIIAYFGNENVVINCPNIPTAQDIMLKISKRVEELESLR